MNRNRLNIQQQPYESDYDYYNRLKEVESSKYDPVFYRQYSANKTTKELKPKMTSLFNNESFIENVMKSINDEYKFIINKFFENIKKEFINKHGFNPNMNVETAVNEIISSIDSPATRLQALFKRKQQQDAIIPELIVKQDEERKQDAINTLSNVLNGKHNKKE